MPESIDPSKRFDGSARSDQPWRAQSRTGGLPYYWDEGSGPVADDVSGDEFDHALDVIHGQRLVVLERDFEALRRDRPNVPTLFPDGRPLDTEMFSDSIVSILSAAEREGVDADWLVRQALSTFERTAEWGAELARSRRAERAERRTQSGHEGRADAGDPDTT